MYRLQEALESAIDEFLESDDPHAAERLNAGIGDMIPDVAGELAESMLRTIKKGAFTGNLQEATAERLAFEERLEAIWRRPIDLLDLFIHLSTEAGTDFNSAFREEAVSSGDAVFEALTKLHGRACQVAKEILTLLRSGFADGAHARWRTLHEIAVVACLIGEHGQDLAERYLLHQTIEQYKLACQYQKHYAALKHEPLSQEEFDELKESRDHLVEKFGAPFKRDYGWAASVIDNPTMSELEEKADLDHWRPYYKMASDNVHPNAHGAYYRLGLASHQGSMILAGPSNEGLADPGHATSISLLQVTLALLSTEADVDSPDMRPNLDCIVVSHILQSLSDEIGQAFHEAHLFVEELAGEG